MFGARHGFRVCMGARYLGGYIGDKKFKHYWLRERTLILEKNINTIGETAGKYPQEIYAAVVREIKSQWIFIQHVTWDTGDLFAGMEKMIRKTFLPRLFFRKTKILGDLSTIPDKKDGLGIQNKVTPDQEK